VLAFRFKVLTIAVYKTSPCDRDDDSDVSRDPSLVSFFKDLLTVLYQGHLALFRHSPTDFRDMIEVEPVLARRAVFDWAETDAEFWHQWVINAKELDSSVNHLSRTDQDKWKWI
jgi:hypothetical protein